MKSYKFLASAASLLMAVAMVSCDKDNNDDDKILSNHVYFTTEGPTTLVQGSGMTVDVHLTLSQAVAEATSFELTASGEAADCIAFDPETVTVTAGTNTADFTVSLTDNVKLTKEAVAAIEIKNLNEDAFDVRATVRLSVLPAAQYSEEEAAFAQAFQAANDVDLLSLFGDLTLAGTIEFPGGGNLYSFTEPTTINLSGTSSIHLNPASTMERVIIDMTANPMGMNDYLHDSFRKLTIEDKEFFALDDEDNFGGPQLMNLINWNENTNETFKATISGMVLDFAPDHKTATVSFVTEGENFYLNPEGEPFVDSEGEPIYMTWNDNRIGFEYSYTAWDRNLEKIVGGDPTAIELLGYGISAHPGAWLGMSSVLDDEWLLEEDGEVSLYCQPTGVIDFEAGTMTFEFPFDHADQYGYSRVKVTYKLK